MNRADRRRVLAIGIDAAEPTLVRALLERGELPALGRLLAEGTWSRVTCPAAIGSSAVWPTFMTGTEPHDHGVYGEWLWRPEDMSIGHGRPQGLTPFWRDLAQEGMTIGVLDVPLAPLVGLTRGFEISDWGAYDTPDGRIETGPAAVAATIRQVGPHPFASYRPDAAGPDDHEALTRASAACLAGVALRGRLAARLLDETAPDLSIVVFPEIHSASHLLWHTIAPGHAFYTDERFRRARAVTPGLADLLREVDRQIARLVEVVGPEAAIFVFGLHGIQPTRGVPTLLGPLLRETGFARAAGWRTQSWSERGRSVFAAAKRRMPRRLRALYYRAMSRGVTHRLARTTMLPVYDWRHTRAFSLPTDQHGWIRINLAGRERQGIVPRERYADTCDELANLMRGLTTVDARPVVHEVIEVARDHAGTPPARLPDLVVHWTDAAFDDPLRLSRPALTAAPTGLKFSGQHAPDGFCIAKGAGDGIGPSVAARDLHRLITHPLRASG